MPDIDDRPAWRWFWSSRLGPVSMQGPSSRKCLSRSSWTRFALNGLAVNRCGGSSKRVGMSPRIFAPNSMATSFRGFSTRLRRSSTKLAEEDRVEALSKVGLLVELGLPTEAAAKVFLAGVRSRAAAVELSRFVTDPAASVSRIRKALLDSASVTALSASVSASTLEWLHLLSAEHGATEVVPPQCAKFRLEAPDGVNTLHVRQLQPEGHFWLCSTDVRFKYAVQATEEMPFDKFANDPRFIFSRDGDEWVQQCRDPRIRAFSLEGGLDGLPLRVSNKGLLRPRVARAQESP